MERTAEPLTAAFAAVLLMAGMAFVLAIVLFNSFGFIKRGSTFDLSEPTIEKWCDAEKAAAVAVQRQRHGNSERHSRRFRSIRQGRQRGGVEEFGTQDASPDSFAGCHTGFRT